MTGEDYERIVTENHEFVLVDYFRDLDVFSFRYVAIPSNVDVKNVSPINSFQKCFTHEEYDYYPQYDGDFVYIVKRKSIPLPLSPFMLHFANIFANEQKSYHQEWGKLNQK